MNNTQSPILAPLNPQQQLAVAAPPKSVLVLAGAGSGKTRVLVHRIAWLIEVENVSPLSILAVTFTNKAAAEMRGRIQDLLQLPSGGMWVGTFHGISHRLLRLHWQQAKLPQTFQILDSEDQICMVKRILEGGDLGQQWLPARVNPCTPGGGSSLGRERSKFHRLKWGHSLEASWPYTLDQWRRRFGNCATM